MKLRSIVVWQILLCLVVLGSGCQASEAGSVEEGVKDMAIQVTSSALIDGEKLPVRYTCDGDNISPPLSWSGIPVGTKSVALIIADPDAPRGNFTHWMLVDMQPNIGGVEEGERGIGVEGKNDFGKPGYGGPCPPKGSSHRYYFIVYALDKTLDLKAGFTRSDVEKAMQEHILTQGQLIGHYGR